MIEYTSDITAVVTNQMGTDRDICNAARVSTLGAGAEEAKDTGDVKLIEYLMKNKHGSPFEHGAITFIVTAPIFVFWDHVRHRIGVSYNIESSRYRELQPLFYRASEARTQTGKPGHYVMTPGTPEQTQAMHSAKEVANTFAWNSYQAQLKAGIAREQAMEVLPMNTVISAYVTFNPRSLMKFLELRLGPARQEMQMLAHAYMDRAFHFWPHTFDTFETGGLIAP